VSVAIDPYEDLLTIAEVAELMKVSRRTVERRILDGTLETRHIHPRSVRVTRESVERWASGTLGDSTT